MGDEKNEGRSSVVDVEQLAGESLENLEAAGAEPVDAHHAVKRGVTLGAELHANDEESTLRVIVARMLTPKGRESFDLFCYLDDRPGAAGKLAIVPASRAELLALRDRLTAVLAGEG